MPSRRIPSVEEAYKIFNEDPYKPLSEWAREWNCSHERVRQLREQAGFPPISSIDHKIAITVIDRIRNGEYKLTVREMYDDLPIGLEKFMTWMKEDPAIYLGVLEAQQYVKLKEWNPDTKVCRKCNEKLEIKHFGKSQKYKDGRQKVCKICKSEPSQRILKIQMQKDTMEALREKLKNQDT